MSNKIQLQTNDTVLDSLISIVNAAKDLAVSLPEAGGGSGGISTCNVTISITSQMIDPVMNCAVVINDEITSVDKSFTSTAYNIMSINIENVVCGGLILIRDYLLPTTNYSVNGTAKIVQVDNESYHIIAPIVNGENCSINFN